MIHIVFCFSDAVNSNMTCLYNKLVQLSQDLETVKQGQLETEKELNKTKGLLMTSNILTDLILVDFNSR